MLSFGKTLAVFLVLYIPFFQAALCFEPPPFLPEALGLQISGICQSKICFPSGCLSVKLKPQETFALKQFSKEQKICSAYKKRIHHNYNNGN